MNLLIDTCTFLCLVQTPARIPRKARGWIEDGDNDVFLSHLSLWEIIIKYQVGRLPLPSPPNPFVLEQCKLHRIELLPMTLPDILGVAQLPMLHADPFDRLLIAQAMAQDMTILTSDAKIRRYTGRAVWE